MRTVGFMALQGMGANQIAFVLKQPEDKIQAMFEDPTLQEMFAREIEARGKYALKQLASGMAVDVMLALHKIVLDPAAKPSERINAGKEILDRAFGRPTPANKNGDADGDEGFVGANPEETLAKLEAELEAKLQEREKRRAALQTDNTQRP